MAKRGRPPKDRSQHADSSSSGGAKSKGKRNDLKSNSIFLVPSREPIKSYPPITSGQVNPKPSKKGKERASDQNINSNEIENDNDGTDNRNSTEGTSRRAESESDDDLDEEVAQAPKRFNKQPSKAVSVLKRQNKEGKSDNFRRRALKAWQTKRGRRADADESLASQSTDRMGNSRKGIAGGFNNLPSDDMLQSIQAYATHFYHSMELLLPAQRIKNPRGSQTEGDLEVNGLSSTPSSQSSYSPSDGEAITNSNEIEDILERPREGESQGAPSTEEPGEDEAMISKSRGVTGKRKKRDMYQALEGSALIALAMLVEEHIKTYISQAGYVPALSLPPSAFSTERGSRHEHAPDHDEMTSRDEPGIEDDGGSGSESSFNEYDPRLRIGSSADLGPGPEDGYDKESDEEEDEFDWIRRGNPSRVPALSDDEEDD